MRGRLTGGILKAQSRDTVAFGAVFRLGNSMCLRECYFINFCRSGPSRSGNLL